MATIHQSTELSQFPGFIEVSRRFDQSGSGTAPAWTFEYRGTKDAIRDATYGWSSVGAKYTTIEDGPYASATVIFSGPNYIDANDPLGTSYIPVAGQEDPDIRYEFRTDYLDISLFALPAVVEEAETSGNPAGYKLAIEEAVKSGKKLTGIIENGERITYWDDKPVGRKIWEKLSRGEDSFPLARISLSRVASFSGSLGLPQVPQGIPPVYTPATFASVWQLPFSVQQMLPKVPFNIKTGKAIAPSGSIWGWKQTNYSSSLIAKTNMVEQNISWTFAAYDTDIYPIL
jgi:hypothetical protein